MSKISKKYADRVAAAEADLDRMNSNCLPPFEVDGVMVSSHLCQVGRKTDFPLYTYVYASDKEAAQKVLDEKYSDFDSRIVV